MMIAYLQQIYSYRYLIKTLAAKELKIKYKSAVLGWLWSILNPLLLMLIFSFIFTYVIRVDVEKFPVFLLCGLLPWFFLSLSVTMATVSIVDNASLLKKTYFPLEVIPISVVGANFFNFLISLILFIIFLVCFGIYPTMNALYLSAVVVSQFIFVLGVSLVACTLHTMFRDIKYAVELGLVIWFYATPIFYPVTLVPERFRALFYFNPLTLFIMFYRDILLYKRTPDLILLTACALLSLTFLFFGGYIFSKFKKTFIDII
ncbi:MAG: ABC transporter permease [Candidatus Omnitrophica bacterium]|nr:ABC transporter permease [Candidatus Omnitrophota bacterium]MBU1925377.1 ABC transporter permease [Candidatus Omnitrophota bacterium]